MASNRPAPEAPFVSAGHGSDTFGHDVPRAEEGPWEEWNPTAESIRPVRGRHRVAKQRGGLARSSTVLGVGVIAAVGAGGMASAQTGKPPVAISMPDLPNVGSLMPGGEEEAEPEGSATPLSGIAAASAGVSDESAADAGESLRARIMAQAEQQQAQVESKAAAEAQAAAEKKAQEAAAKAEKEAEAKAAAAKKKAEEEAAKKAEAERLAKLAKQYTLPTSSYTISSTFGQAGAYWSSGHHTGLDFAAPTGTLLKAVHSGTITSAGWDGSYGYKTVLTLDDGTELWYAHQSSISVNVGQKVATGDVIGRVGATGNVTGAHLHLEVHPDGGSGIDPMAWLQGKGINP
ncbi:MULTISPECIES: M23 family metallopeptidase [Streptomyces]|uniref:M23 family metallopeptidase n=1 Tax=Streptomyces lienomycini TaxID=284035 RepID=A0ABV9WXN0_9ACTN|nr:MULTISPECIES: M23 family metallopeptidase [Streptomyces]